MARFYQYVEQVWVEDDGSVSYYAAQSYDEDGKNDEILAHGVGSDWDDAVNEVTEAYSESHPHAS